LKETFDIDVVPSIRLVQGDQIYHLKWKQGGFWKSNDLSLFIQSGYEIASVEKIRPRVSEGLELYAEYIVNTLTHSSFTPAMENYLAGRKWVQVLTGYKHDLK